MKHKKIILFFLVLGIIASFMLIFQYFLSIEGLENLKTSDKIAVWSVTAILLIYYIKVGSKPQLVPSILAIEKENNSDKDKPNVSFKDVAGLEEIKEELQETIDFINNSYKYKSMGAKIPKGILFYGPPGTGKTLLAKAVAGETNSNFLCQRLRIC